MLKVYPFLILLTIISLCTTQSDNTINNINLQRKHFSDDNIPSKWNKNTKTNNIKINTNSNNNQKLTVIGYASDGSPARHLISFSKRYNLDFHLIGVNKPWRGFNDKIKGFYDKIKSIDNKHNNSVILILDAYDTVPICSQQDLLSKFNSFNSDIVISTGKDCWPDPNVAEFLTNRLTKQEKEKYKWFPWFLCPNSGAIMGRHDAMLSMFERVQQLVSIGNGSCHDFEGNAFTKNTQSDQRCYTTYYVELTKYHEYTRKLANKSLNSNDTIIDISKISKSDNDFITFQNHKELHKYYADISIALDYENKLFFSMGGMMFMNIYTDISNNAKDLSFKNKITNGSSCILHGNGPGVILWRSYVKQIKNNGNLYVDDYVLRVGVDFFHWILWWIIMPCERLSHWLSVTYKFDLGFHSTSFSEEVIWSFHVWTFVGIVLLVACPLLYWYKYKFKKNMKINNGLLFKYSDDVCKDKEKKK
eukprot:364323_1